MRHGHRRQRPFWMVALSDLGLLIVSLLVFALFHHVIPRAEQAVGTTSDRTAVSVSAGEIGEIGFADEDETPDETADDDDDGFDELLTLAMAPSPSPSPEPTIPPATLPPALTAVQEILEPEQTIEPSPTPDPVGYFGTKFADKFTDGEVIRTSDSYQSENLNIKVAKYKVAGSTCTVADIYMRDITSFATVFAENRFARHVTDTVLNMANSVNAIIAVNGDYYGMHTDGVVIRNGTLYRKDDHPDRDVCVLFWDGTMKTYAYGSFDSEAAMKAGALQSWCFGPRLLNSDGSARTQFHTSVAPANPRTAIGYFEPGHYCLVTVDGRSSDSNGMTMKQLAKLMSKLGCMQAYNLDGGQSSVMVGLGSVLNDPYKGGRNISDIIAIIEPQILLNE